MFQTLRAVVCVQPSATTKKTLKHARAHFEDAAYSNCLPLIDALRLASDLLHRHIAKLEDMNITELHKVEKAILLNGYKYRRG